MLSFLLGAAWAAIPHCTELDRVTPSDGTPVEERVGLLRNTLWLGLRVYRVAISPADGARCTLYPSCSTYALAAVEHSGLPRGVWLGAARLLRSHRDPDLPICVAGGRTYRYAPVTEDVWWSSAR